ncbi:MAG: hypothetical protein FJ206_15170 [Gemmatimonadetes bacterium]|nr:hypothetical protein [Gemmatimonadota bacterium]
MRPNLENERGVALILTLLITMAVAAMAIGGVMISGSGMLTSKFNAKEAALHSLADAGLEIARDSINRALTILPETGHIQIVPASTITDASGATIPGFTREVYAGKTGGRTGGPATSGQYGSNFMSIVSRINDVRGTVAARRGLFSQESWSRFAVAINNWGGSAVYGCGESIAGPFHSNSTLRLQSGCTTPKVDFFGQVTVVGSISNPRSGNFTQGYTTGAPALAWPTAAQLATMRQYAQDADQANGDYDITGGNTGTNRPCTRLDFAVLDSNRDGIIQWDEGYYRVFKCLSVSASTLDSSLAMVNGRRWTNINTAGMTGTLPTLTTDPNLLSPNCGGVVNARPWTTARGIWANMTALGRTANQRRDTIRVALTSPQRRCFLGGDPRLRGNTPADTLLGDSTSVNFGLPVNFGGKWITRRLGPHSSVTPVRNTVAGGGDADYWIPLGKNPNFKGVVYVTGDVAISGTLRGRVSVVATGNINLADDFQYWTTPGTNCSETGDIFGAISSSNVVIQDNSLQTPFRVGPYPAGVPYAAWAGGYVGGFDDTPAAENYHLFMLMLGNFMGDIPGIPVYTGPASPAIPGTLPDRCANAAAGCIRVTGGMGLGNVDWWTYYGVGSSNSSGWAEAHAYDPCGATNPPPYFPTTGRFVKSRYYELDPVWLNQTGIASYFRELQSR